MWIRKKRFVNKTIISIGKWAIIFGKGTFLVTKVTKISRNNYHHEVVMKPLEMFK